MKERPPARVGALTRIASIGGVSSLAFAAALAAQEAGSLTGRVVDISSGAPVSGALVALEAASGGPQGVRALTDDDGRFRLSPVPEGLIRISVEHAAFGVHWQEVMVEGAGTGGVEITISPVAIRLDPLVVEADASGDFSGPGSPSSRNAIDRAAIDRARTSGQTLGDLLRRTGGITVSVPAAAGGQPCLEFRGARRGDGICRPPAVLLDGMPLADPSAVLGTFDLSELGQIQLVPPAEAGARFGTISGWGVILLTTRLAAAQGRGLVPSIQRTSLAARPSEWSEVAEGEDYPWLRVYSAAFLGSSAGLVAAGAILGQCMDLGTRRFYRGDQYCGWGPLLGAGLAAVVLPPLAGSLAGRLGGATERSRGSLGRSLALSMPVMVPALALVSINAGSEGMGPLEISGLVILVLGTPALNTVADHLFRHDRR